MKATSKVTRLLLLTGLVLILSITASLLMRPPASDAGKNRPASLKQAAMQEKAAVPAISKPASDTGDSQKTAETVSPNRKTRAGGALTAEKAQPSSVIMLEVKALRSRAQEADRNLRKFSPDGSKPDFKWDGLGFSPEYPEQLQRDALAAWYDAKFWQAKARAWEVALEKGWEVKGPSFELMQLDDDGSPIYATTDNANARISTGVPLIQNVSPYNSLGALNGSGFRAGVWDEGAIRNTHQEFGSRVNIMDGASFNDHGTHVGGTIGAGGFQSAALGMAPGVNLRSYDWNSDTAELLSAGAASGTALTGSVGFSNHSYGWASGWNYRTSPVSWWGRRGDRESERFGRYTSQASAYDDLATKIPFCLIFRSAGNDRNDNTPASGTTFVYGYDGTSKTFVPSTDPFNDGYDGGFDTLGGGFATAKNVITVGAANDAVSGGARSPSSATMSDFSGWGPTDDGRIKPDIVANGVGVYSPVAGANTSYGNYDGTSMSTPNACGSAVLLQELYWKNFSNTAMRADLLKALIIHTADDIGNAGPDYSNGWGLMNVKAAADLILSHKANTTANTLAMGSLNNTTATTASYQFEWSGSGPLRVTLCWIDPPGTEKTGLDNTARALINDLDIRLTRAGGTTHNPYMLSRTSPASLATTGDNIVDNVEQIHVASPSTGLYTLTVSKKGTLTGTQQNYALVISGHRPANALGIVVSPTSLSASTLRGANAATQTFTVRNSGTGSLNYSITDNATWMSVSPASGTSTGETDTISVTYATSGLAAGVYSGNITVSATGTSSVNIPVTLTVTESSVTLAQGLDVGVTLGTHGATPWLGVTTPNHDGLDAGRSGSISNSQETGFTMNVTGPGTISYWWKVDSESGRDFLDLDVDGVTVQSISGNQNWASVLQNITSGNHVIRWKYRKDASGLAGADAGWVDEVVFQSTATFLVVSPADLVTSTPVGSNAASQSFTVQNQGAGVMSYSITDNVSWLSVSPTSGTSSGEADVINVNYSTSGLSAGVYNASITVTAGGSTFLIPVTLNVVAVSGSGTIADAVDTTGQTWTLGGSSNWFRQTVFTRDGVDAAQSGPIAHSQSTSISSTFTGPGTLNFWWKVDSEASYDYLELWINGVRSTSISGAVDWTQVSQPLGSGSNTIEFRYTKDGSVVVGQDSGWVDMVSTSTTSDLNTALDNSTLTFVDQGWGSQTTYTFDGVDAAASDTATHGESRSFQFNANGPSTLSFRWKVSSEQDFDYLSLLVDGALVQRISGEVNWTLVNHPLTTGAHTVRLEYSKDGSVNTGLDRAFVDTLSISTASLPAAPGGVIASDGTSSTGVDLTWNSSTGALSYNIHRNTTNSTSGAIQIASNITTTTYADTTAAAGTTYFYWITATNAAGTSGFSTSDSGFRAAASQLISNGTLSAQIRTDNGAIDWIKLGTADFYESGTPVSNWGFQAGTNTSTFRLNTTDGSTGQAVTVAGTTVSGTYTAGSQPVAFQRAYSLVPGQNALKIATTLTNQGSSNIDLRYFETTDPDQGVAADLGFETRLDVIQSGAVRGAQASATNDLTCILHSDAGSTAVLAAGEPFQIDGGDALNTVVSSPFDANGTLLDMGTHLVHVRTLSPGVPQTVLTYVSFGTTTGAAQSTMLAAAASGGSAVGVITQTLGSTQSRWGDIFQSSVDYIEEAELITANGTSGDAFDGVGILSMTPSVSLSPLTASSAAGPLTSSGTSGTLAASRTVRLVSGRHATDEEIRVTNNGSSSQSVTLEIDDNYGSDGSTAVHGTSSGDSVVTSSDTWFVISDQTTASAISSDPAIMVSWAVNGLPAPSFSVVPGAGNDHLAMNFGSFSIPAGQTVTITIRRELFDSGSLALANGLPLSASSRGQLTSPAPGSTLPSTALPFTWSAGSGVSNYWLYVGSAVGGSDYHNSNSLANSVLSQNVTGLPSDGRTVHARLWSLVSGAWVYNDYTFTAFTAAVGTTRGVITSPAPSSVLASTSPTFAWSAGSGATSYWLYVGSSVGGTNYHNSGSLSSGVLSRTVSGLPNNGSSVHVRLYSLIAGAWVYDDYTYTASSVAETVSTPGTPFGPTSGSAGISYTYTTDGSNSNIGSGVQYQFDWGDGTTSAWLAVGTTTASKTWSAPGFFSVRARARSAANTSVVSSASASLGVSIANAGSTRGVMSSPVPGSIFAGTAMTFTWNAGSSATAYWLYVGSSVGGTNYHNSGNLATSVLNRTVTGLPSNGSTVYARLYSLVGGAWVYDDYTYTASTAVAETVSTPTTPTGSASGTVGTSYSFTTGGSTSSLANPVQYQFDWGDGSNSGWLTVGTTSAAKTWAAPGTYSVRAQARSSVNTAAVSALSGPLSITITGGGGGGGSTRGVMTSPANGVTFASTTVTFTWSAGTASTGYYLYVGSTPGGTDYLNSGALGAAVTSRTVSGLPNDARTVYARLWSQVSGAWVYDDYSYTASGSSPKAQMTTPAPGSAISSTTTFNWSAGGGATGYWLYVGNAVGGTSYHDSGSLGSSVVSRTVTGLPTNGSTIYVRLWSLVSGAWVYNDYTYTASTAVAETVSTPTTPTGSASGTVGTSYSFTTGGSTSSLANPVQYQFDWGDGSNSGWLTVGTTSAAKTWAAPGTYSVRAQARSSVNTAAVSALSGTLSVTITGGGGGSTRGVMTSPANGVTFASTTVTFTWSAGTASTGYYLYVGSTPGGTDYLNSGALGAAVTSRTVSGLPNDARTVYARLWSQVSGAWVYDDYSYIASGTSPKAQMTTPAPGSTVSGSVTFNWTAGTATAYWLYIGNSAGSTSIHNSGNLPAGTLSRTVTVPSGAKFVRLWSLVAGAWVYNDYTYN